MKAFIFTTSTLGDWEFHNGFFVVIDNDKESAEKQFFEKVPDALPLKDKKVYFQNLIEITEIDLNNKAVIELLRATDM